MDARRANDRIAEKAERLQFLSRVPMLCECSQPGCHTILMVSLAEYEQIRSDPDNFLTAPNHALEGAALMEETASYTVQRLPSRRDENGGCGSA